MKPSEALAKIIAICSKCDHPKAPGMISCHQGTCESIIGYDVVIDDHELACRELERRWEGPDK